MSNEFNRDEILKAFDTIESIVGSNCQMLDHFYSGDKDTLIEAFNRVLTKHNLPRYYSLSRKQLEYYDELYHEEINEIFVDLVNFGKEELEKSEITRLYLKKLRASYENSDVTKTDDVSSEDRVIDNTNDEDLPF